jgi:hypothetical protein
LILTAILLVTVFVVELDTAVETNMSPVDAGSVTTLDPATSGVVIEIDPDVLPVRTTELIFTP